MDITLALGLATAALKTSRPILPNPLIPRRTEDIIIRYVWICLYYFYIFIYLVNHINLYINFL